ncbi:MAG: 3'-5' exonuclease [Methylococcaceae bacterium]
MANFITPLNSCIQAMQAGEKRFSHRLDQFLDEEYFCWFETPLGKKKNKRYSDFIVLHPGRGLLLLEVKDWLIGTISKMDPKSTTLKTSRGFVIKSNPLEQVRQCSYKLISSMQKDKELTHEKGKYKGNLIFPYGFGVVLTSITRNQFDENRLGDVLPEHLVICKDEMLESMEPETFQEQLWNMFEYTFGKPLTNSQIDRVRWHIFPEIRIGNIQPDMFRIEASPETTAIPDIIRVMDMQQEQLARSMGEGHRIVHGVAGSGKTLILGYRSQYLAEVLRKPILVLCFNTALASHLRTMISENSNHDLIQVYHFHNWCTEILDANGIAKPGYTEKYYDKLISHVREAVKLGKIPKGQYGALLIDEGHDFQAEWLELVVQMLDPDTNSLLFLYDDAQSLYKKSQKLDFTLSSVGIEARGRTTILRVNYRNTEEIIRFAYNFSKRYFDISKSKDEQIPLIEPESIGRHGPSPYIKECMTLSGEAKYIARTCRRLYKDGTPWNEMAILYRSKKLLPAIKLAFEEMTIPIQLITSKKAKEAYCTLDNKVKILTMHSSKGLEFPFVAIPAVDLMPFTKEKESDAAKLLYVAMTRSTDKLLLTHSSVSPFIQQLKTALGNETANKSAIKGVRLD